MDSQAEIDPILNRLAALDERFELFIERDREMLAMVQSYREQLKAGVDEGQLHAFGEQFIAHVGHARKRDERLVADARAVAECIAQSLDHDPLPALLRTEAKHLESLATAARLSAEVYDAAAEIARQLDAL